MNPYMSRTCRVAALCATVFASLIWTSLTALATEPVPLTNADVIKMLDSKLPESVIVAKIKSGKGKFDTSTDAIIEMSGKGASEGVLNAIIAASEAGGDAQSPQSEQQPPQPTAPPVTPTADKPSTLSYGTAAGLVKKGETTQKDIIDLFGGPDVMTTDRDGTEIWMYDRKTSVISTSGNSTMSQQQSSEANQMAAFLGIPLIAGVSGSKEKGKTDTVGSSQHSGEVRSSSKTITFIIKFNPDKTVKDFAVRQSTY